MSIYRSGSLTRSGGIFSAIAKEMRTIKLTAIKKIEINFDPFLTSSLSTRQFLYNISNPKIRLTNPKCTLKTFIQNKREEPFIQLSLIKGDEIKFKAGNLTLLELLQLYNKYVTPHNPVEQITTNLSTKTIKKGLKTKK